MKLRLSVIVCITGVILSSSSFCPAQNWPFQVVKNNLINLAADVGDFNNDNAPDILLHETATLLVWYENTQPGWITHTIDPNIYTVRHVQFTLLSPAGRPVVPFPLVFLA